MTEVQIQELKAIGYDIATTIKKEKDKKWFKYFQLFRKHLENNKAYPTFLSNKDLFTWVRTQRDDWSNGIL